MWAASKILLSIPLLLLAILAIFFQLGNPLDLEGWLIPAVLMLCLIALWTKNWAKFDIIMPFLGIAVSIAGAFYAVGILTGDIVHVLKPCSAGKGWLICETMNVFYAMGGPMLWGALWLSVALLLLYLSRIALKENVANRKELPRTGGKRER